MPPSSVCPYESASEFAKPHSKSRRHAVRAPQPLQASDAAKPALCKAPGNSGARRASSPPASSPYSREQYASKDIKVFSIRPDPASTFLTQCGAAELVAPVGAAPATLPPIQESPVAGATAEASNVSKAVISRSGTARSSRTFRYALGSALHYFNDWVADHH